MLYSHFLYCLFTFVFAVMAGHTVVEYFAEHERYRCGYCGSSDTNYSHGMWAHSMTVQDYQDLLDRGWRRSGKYVYKPTMNQTCCPQYPIRCEALNFKLRKSHKKVLKKVNKYLIEGIKPSTDKDDETANQSVDDTKPVTQSEPKVADGNSAGSDGIAGSTSDKPVKTPRKGAGADPNKPKCKKAKDLRREKKLAKQAAQQSDKGQANTQLPGPSKKKTTEVKTLEDWLSEPDKAKKCAHKLEIRLVRSGPQSKEFEDSLAETHSVYEKYQMAIHKDPPSKPNMRQFTRFLIDSPLEVRLIRSYPKSNEFMKSYEESYKVYKRYQMTVHKDGEDDCTKHGYDGFLVDSPLESQHPGGTLPMGYGSFHQQYILDGKIICVGVIDILPSLVSSKYLYYDPDYHFLSLGTYSALREMAFVRELHQKSADMIYYYMGFYIHSCPKMKYKGQYFPSFLVCPETYEWCPVEKCSPMLDQNTYCRFADPDKSDPNGGVDLDKVTVLYQRQLMTYPIYNMLGKKENKDEDEVREYAGFVGRKCANSIFLYRK